MAELNHAKIVATYLSLQEMELMLINAGIGDGIKNASELKVLNYIMMMRSPSTDEWRKEVKNKNVQFNSIMRLRLYQEVLS